MKKFIFLLFVSLFVADGIAIGIVLRARYDESGVKLRWASDRFDHLPEELQAGFEIFRVSNSDNTKLFSIENRKAMVVPRRSDDSFWEENSRKNPAVIFVRERLFSLEKSNTQTQKMLNGLLLLLCDTDSLIAESCGLFFCDKSVKINTEYVYGIRSLRSDDTASVFISTYQIQTDPTPSLPVVICKRNLAEIIWPRSLKSFYSSWVIERSTDALQWQIVNQNPVIDLQNPEFETDKIHFLDSGSFRNQKWFYRVAGISPFGTAGPYSPIADCYCYPEISAIPSIDTAYRSGNSLIVLLNSIASVDSSCIRSLTIQRQELHSGVFSGVSFDLLENGKVLLNTGSENGYLRIQTILNNGDTLYSWPYLIFFPDDCPPSKPRLLSGEIDSSGVLRISWQINDEPDLSGYRIFFRNDDSDEWMEETQELIRDNSFQKRIDMRTLQSRLYCSVIATDLTWNQSERSEELLVTIPDFVAPSAPVWKGIKKGNDSLSLFWASASDAETFLFMLDRNRETILFPATENDTLMIAIPPGAFELFLVSKDRSGNRSYSDTLQFSGFSLKKDAADISAFRLEDKIRIEFKFHHSTAHSAVIYRSSDGITFRPLITLFQSSGFYYDLGVRPGRQYFYRVKFIQSTGNIHWSNTVKARI